VTTSCWTLIAIISLAISGCQSPAVRANAVAGTVVSTADAATIDANTLHEQVGPLRADGVALPFDPSCEAEQRIYLGTAQLPGINTAVALNVLLVRSLSSVYVDPNQQINLSRCVRNPYFVKPK